jgi:hypothetical protein
MGWGNQNILQRFSVLAFFAGNALILQACSQSRFGFSQPVENEKFQMVSASVSATPVIQSSLPSGVVPELYEVEVNYLPSLT